MITIVEASSFKSIFNALLTCAPNFYDQKRNNESDIYGLALKFTNRANVIIASENGEVAGFLAYYSNDLVTRSSYISMIVCRARFQGSGLGTRLLQYMIDDCIKRDFYNIKLEVATSNIAAIGFYVKRGFVRLDKATTMSDYYVLYL